VAGGVVLPYRPFPAEPYGAASLEVVEAAQVDGNPVTRNVAFARRLDYLLASARLLSAGEPPAEVYHSALEEVSPGLPKLGVPPAAGASALASDHLVTFADFHLLPRPALAVAVAPVAGGGPLDERAGAGAVAGVVVLPEPAGLEGVEVEVLVRHPDEAHGPGMPLRVAPGEVSAGFSIDVLDDRVADPDARVVVSASAPGFATAYAAFRVANVQADGRVLFSQYHDPATGTLRKAVEVFNASGSVLDFAVGPLLLRRYVNGGALPVEDLVLSAGTLGAGRVLVAGDTGVGEFLTSQGVLALAPGDAAALENGTAVAGPDGGVAFVKQPMLFNGDDALELVLGGVRADVFGAVGDDPGEAWSGGGVETRDANLARRPAAAHGSAGWSDPSLRFETAAPGGDLAGFGAAPALASPYAAWAGLVGLPGWLSGPEADADADGFPNLWEFASATDPTDADSFAPPVAVAAPDGDGGPLLVAFRRRADTTGIDYSLEVSSDGRAWSPATAAPPAPPEPDGDDAEWTSWRVDVAVLGGGPFLVRVRVALL
jgi:hypothetical protein